MKVVLFCGGQGLRIREGSDATPKPMVTIDDRPILWHMMRYYAHYGHKDFIVCLGYGAQAFIDYFVRDSSETPTKIVLSHRGEVVEIRTPEGDVWRVTLAETGLDTSIGERLRRVRHHLDDDEMFLANYGDLLSDAPLDQMISEFQNSSAVATLLAVRPPGTFHTLRLGLGGRVQSITPISDLPVWANGGFFVLRREIFNYLGPNEDLVGDALPRLLKAGQLVAFAHPGFWHPMDTQKERSHLRELKDAGEAPWAVWESTDDEPVVIPLQEMTNARV